MKPYLAIDFGSTFTKVTAIDIESETILGAAQASTTIDTDVRFGLEKALSELQQNCGISDDDFIERFASSSAAGGLKMVSIGLVPSLTLEAAKRAALGAGAKVVGSYGFELTQKNIQEIEAMQCDIIMLAGGTDGGNKDVIIHNASMLASSEINCPVLICGNSAVQDEVRDILCDARKNIYQADNVLPEVDKVCIESAQEVIREIFVEHITKAKGLERIAAYIKRDIVPTPKATLDAAVLIADGTKEVRGLGSVLVLEIGGATINVHSVEEVRAVSPHAIIRGLPENKMKRTVEGDLGIRWNASTICSLVGKEVILENLKELVSEESQSRMDPSEITSYLSANTSFIPKTAEDYSFDTALALSAANVAVQRHAGTVHTETIVTGEVEIQRGKNLLETQNVIGVGGIFRYGKHPETILKAAQYTAKHPESLRPKNPRLFTDQSYILYAVGLLSKIHPDSALRIAKKYLQPLQS